MLRGGALCEIDKRKYYDDHEINIDGDEELFQWLRQNY